MLFNSFDFIFGLLPVALLGYYLAARVSARLAIGWLVAVSIFFYGWWRPSDLPIFLGSIGFNFFIGTRLRRAGPRRGWLIAGIATDLVVLGVFKYGAFFAGNLRALTGWPAALPSIALPLGISFFTFTQITYLVDTYRRQGGEAAAPLPNFALFVSFFPHLLAGPILHHGDMLPQFADRANKDPRVANLWRGLALFGIGLSKKVLLADALAPFARFGFDGAAPLSLLDAWLAALAYTFQIYFDFSGYTDMAIGAALLFNIRLPFNFNSPYRACDIQSFWRRWHITLGTFFRDYLYIPLGGSRLGRGRTLANLFTVALMSGLWHGAAWSFVLWGGLHGAAMVVHNLWKGFGWSLPRPAAWAVIFLFVIVSWIPFRAPDWPHTRAMLAGIAGRQGIVLPAALKPTLARWKRPLSRRGITFGPLATPRAATLLAYLAVAALISWWPVNSNRFALAEHAISHWQLAAIALLASFSVLNLNRLSEFIYFNF